MNETMKELLENVRRTAIQAGDVAADAAYAAGKKAGELLSVAKLNIRIVELKADVNVAMREVGELLYATHTGTPTASDILQAKLEEIDALKARIRELEDEIRREAQAHTCPTCGAAVREGDVFCGACGDAL